MAYLFPNVISHPSRIPSRRLPDDLSYIEKDRLARVFTGTKDIAHSEDRRLFGVRCDALV